MSMEAFVLPQPAELAGPIAVRRGGIGVALAGLAALLGWAFRDPASPIAVSAAVLGAVAILIAGFGVAQAPKSTLVLGLASVTALLASFATNPEWDAIRLLQWVMAGVAAFTALVVLLPSTGQKIVISLLVLYHFAGVLSAITSPHPQPWLTSQLWARVFRPHLEFSYVNNAYQFYSPQPGPAQVLWFCVTGEDGQSRWLKLPRRSEFLDPLSIEYFRRLSLTERANQNVATPYGPNSDVTQLRASIVQEIPMHPEILPGRQYRSPNEHARQLLRGYARHVANVIGSGRPGVPVRNVKVYLTQHRMLSQREFADNKDPYDPDTYWPFFVGDFRPDGTMINPYDPMLYWIVPVLRMPDGTMANYVTQHAESDPFDPKLEWRVEK